MASYSVQIKASAAKELERVAKSERTRIITAIDQLGKNPFLGKVLKGDLRGLRRIRVSNYRVIYEVRGETLIVLVVRVAHRSDAYRPKS